MPDALIIGYGNILRRDAALGIHAAHALQDVYRDDPQVRVLATSQLFFELAEDLSQVQFVLFLDATAGQLPGTVAIKAIKGQDAELQFGHHCTPYTLLAAVGRLYGNTPSAISLRMVAASFEAGIGLSQEVKASLPGFLEGAREIVDNWRLGLKANEPGKCDQAMRDA